MDESIAFMRTAIAADKLAVLDHIIKPELYTIFDDAFVESIRPHQKNTRDLHINWLIYKRINRLPGHDNAVSTARKFVMVSEFCLKFPVTPQEADELIAADDYNMSFFSKNPNMPSSTVHHLYRVHGVRTFSVAHYPITGLSDTVTYSPLIYVSIFEKPHIASGRNDMATRIYPMLSTMQNVNIPWFFPPHIYPGRTSMYTCLSRYSYTIAQIDAFDTRHKIYTGDICIYANDTIVNIVKCISDRGVEIEPRWFTSRRLNQRDVDDIIECGLMPGLVEYIYTRGQYIYGCRMHPDTIDILTPHLNHEPNFMRMLWNDSIYQVPTFLYEQKNRNAISICEHMENIRWAADPDVRAARIFALIVMHCDEYIAIDDLLATHGDHAPACQLFFVMRTAKNNSRRGRELALKARHVLDLIARVEISGSGCHVSERPDVPDWIAQNYVLVEHADIARDRVFDSEILC